MRKISERPIALGLSFILLMLLLATPTVYADDPDTEIGKGGKTGADWDSAPERTGTLLMRQS